MVIDYVYSKLVSNVFDLRLNINGITYLCKDAKLRKTEKVKKWSRNQTLKHLLIRGTFSHVPWKLSVRPKLIRLYDDINKARIGEIVEWELFE